jgi:hypothetical protein
MSSLLIAASLSILKKSFEPSNFTQGCQLISLIDKVGEFHTQLHIASLSLPESFHKVIASPSFNVEF